MKDVVIIGAGLTGLTTGFNLKEEKKDILILEQANRVGGVMFSNKKNGFVFEEGPNSGVLGNIEVVKLFEKLKNDCDLEIANTAAKKRFILKDGKWVSMPSGLISGIRTNLFSWHDKFRILGEPFRKKGSNPHESLAELVVRRMGKSFLDYAIDPFISGVYAGNPEKLITKYALPKLYKLEQEYGSFIGGAIKKGFKSKTEEDKKVTRSVFSVKGGFTNLVNALYKRIGPENVALEIKDIQLNQVKDNHFEVIFKDAQNQTKKITTKKVISTINPFKFNEIFPFIEASQIEKINNIRYAKVIEVAIGFNKWEGIPLDGFGGLIPTKEKRDILGVLFMSSLFENRAPSGGALLTVFMGGIKKPDFFDKPDEEIKLLVKNELMDLMGLSDFNPDLFEIMRHENAIPQYEVPSKERFDMISLIETKFPNLIIGGNLKDGIGMADRILQAKNLTNIVLH